MGMPKHILVYLGLHSATVGITLQSFVWIDIKWLRYIKRIYCLLFVIIVKSHIHLYHRGG